MCVHWFMYHHLPAIIFRIFNFQFLFGGMFRAGGERSVPKVHAHREGPSVYRRGPYRRSPRSRLAWSLTRARRISGGGEGGKGTGQSRMYRIFSVVLYVIWKLKRKQLSHDFNQSKISHQCTVVHILFVALAQSHPLVTFFSWNGIPPFHGTVTNSLNIKITIIRRKAHK